jgi:hypothetical protein
MSVHAPPAQVTVDLSVAAPWHVTVVVDADDDTNVLAAVWEHSTAVPFVNLVLTQAPLLQSTSALVKVADLHVSLALRFSHSTPVSTKSRP